MSRSYKHTPRSGEQKDKFKKKQANKRVRQLPIDSLPLKNKSYRKYTCSYDICDYQTVGISFEQYWESAVASWHRWKHITKKPFPDRKEVYQEYCRWFLRK